MASASVAKSSAVSISGLGFTAETQTTQRRKHRRVNAESESTPNPPDSDQDSVRLHAALPKSRLSGYRTARGSERDKDSINLNGVGAILLAQMSDKFRFQLEPWSRSLPRAVRYQALCWLEADSKLGTDAVCESGTGGPPVNSRARCACHNQTASVPKICVLGQSGSTL